MLLIIPKKVIILPNEIILILHHITLFHMNKEDIVTVKDLETLRQGIFNDVKDLLDKKKSPKEFYSPKEFAAATGIKYSTVVYRCKVGKLKATQENINCSWLIDASEVERLKEEANKNVA